MIEPFPEDGQRGVFERGRARIETDAGDVIASRADPRPAFFGRAGLRRNLRWDALDSAYFAGYAIWNYLTAPLLLTRDGVQVSEGDAWEKEGESWRRLEADFPEGLDTHSRRQTLLHRRQGRLRRHDYVAEVVGGWARAAHNCADTRRPAGSCSRPAAGSARSARATGRCPSRPWSGSSSRSFRSRAGS